MDRKETVPVSGAEQVQVARALLDWLNEYDGFPTRVGRIEAEYLAPSTSVGLFAVTAPYKTQEYISGAYTAQYQFALQYRIAASSSAQRLDAMDALSKIAVWSEKRTDLPDLGEGKHALSIGRNSPAVMIARYEDGSEDYQILMTFDYEVRPQKERIEL